MELNYKSYGQGPALIILHGLFGSLDNWVSHARRLANDFSVYLLDLRNHGKSPHASPFDYPTMAEDLAEFMDDHGIYMAHLLGHSMGGKVVMQFAVEYPERVEKLIVADMAPKTYPPHHTEILEALIQLDMSSLTTRSDAAQYFQERLDDVAVIQFLLKNIARTPDKGFRWKFNLPVIYDSYEEILANVNLEYGFDKSTLFLSGGDSTYLLPEDHDMILSHFPQAQFHSIPGAGHWVHAEAPTAFLEEVIKFLQ